MQVTVFSMSVYSSRLIHSGSLEHGTLWCINLKGGNYQFDQSGVRNDRYLITLSEKVAVSVNQPIRITNRRTTTIIYLYRTSFLGSVTSSSDWNSVHSRIPEIFIIIEWDSISHHCAVVETALIANYWVDIVLLLANTGLFYWKIFCTMQLAKNMYSFWWLHKLFCIIRES